MVFSKSFSSRAQPSVGYGLLIAVSCADNRQASGWRGGMREYQYRGLLSRMVGEDTANSYVAYAGRVERLLGTDLDQLDLTEPGVAKIGRQLDARGVPPASVRNCLSALRAYAKIGR